jgi:hypothetical protein
MSTRHEAEVFLDELNRLYGLGEDAPEGFHAGRPNAAYFQFLRRRVQAIRADNLVLRHEIDRLQAENARLTQHAEWLREQAGAHHLRCQDRIDELTQANHQLREELRQAKAPRGWLRALGRRVRRLCAWRSGHQ